MRGFLAGFVFGVLCAGGAGAAAYLLLRPAAPDPCVACGAGTRCEAQRCVAAAAPPPTPAAKRRRARPGPSGAAAPLPDEPADPPSAPPGPLLSAAELRPTAAGDSLQGSQVVDLTRAEAGDERELSQDELDAVFAAARPAVVACIDAARGDARAASWGRVTLSLRVQRSGAVGGVRVEAPAYLMKRGLLECARRAVSPLKFPASGHTQIVSYPFSLR